MWNQSFLEFLQAFSCASFKDTCTQWPRIGVMVLAQDLNGGGSYRLTFLTALDNASSCIVGMFNRAGKFSNTFFRCTFRGYGKLLRPAPGRATPVGRSREKSAQNETSSASMPSDMTL